MRGGDWDEENEARVLSTHAPELLQPLPRGQGSCGGRRGCQSETGRARSGRDAGQATGRRAGKGDEETKGLVLVATGALDEWCGQHARRAAPAQVAIEV
jgi:hypothetical protein